jgi:hypothetical protein
MWGCLTFYSILIRDVNYFSGPHIQGHHGRALVTAFEAHAPSGGLTKNAFGSILALWLTTRLADHAAYLGAAFAKYSCAGVRSVRLNA